MSSPLRKKAKVECITIESDSDTTDGESTLEQRQQRRERKTVSAHRQRQAAASVTSSIGLTSCPDPEFGFKGHSSPSYVEGSRQYGRSPLHINAIPRLPRGSNVQTLSLSDLLSEGLVETWQINFSIDLAYVVENIHESARQFCIVHFVTAGESIGLQKEVTSNPERINLHKVVMQDQWGSHHSKIMVNFFQNGTCQIVIHTANLLRIDWEEKSEALWLSPMLRRAVPGGPANDEHCIYGIKFKEDFLQYLRAYKKQSMGLLIEELIKYDFSQVQAIFIGSIPGSYNSSDSSFGLSKLRKSLRNSTFQAKMTDQTIAQVSSLGSLGGPFYKEIQNVLNTSPTSQTQPRANTTSSHFRLIFPTVQNVRESLAGWVAGFSLFFDCSKSSGQRQLALSLPHLHSWHADRALRDQVMPHIKTYARTNGDEVKWILVTSSNLSKAAWGGTEHGRLKIKSYEAGVLLVPDPFKEQRGNQVVMKASYGRNDQHADPHVVNIRMCYVLDVKKYTTDDSIWSLQRTSQELGIDSRGMSMSDYMVARNT